MNLKISNKPIELGVAESINAGSTALTNEHIDRHVEMAGLAVASQPALGSTRVAVNVEAKRLGEITSEVSVCE